MNHPQVIFLDAVGTLFGVRGSVGQVYADLAQKFGVTVDPLVLNEGFFKAFRAAPPMAFAGVHPDYIAEREYAWWWAIAAETFQEARVLGQFADFEEFFKALYEHFKTADPWFVYADTRHSLSHWQNQGIELGIVSNFDSRLYAVLEVLELTPFFQSVTISTEVGAAKPSPQLFTAALQKHNCPPQSAWHIGDSYREDYVGSRAAGLRGIWLRRKGEF